MCKKMHTEDNRIIGEYVIIRASEHGRCVYVRNRNKENA